MPVLLVLYAAVDIVGNVFWLDVISHILHQHKHKVADPARTTTGACCPNTVGDTDPRPTVLGIRTPAQLSTP